MGDRSGHFAGHQGGEMPSCSNPFFHHSGGVIRALFCWKISSTRLFSFSSWGSKCSVSKSRYFKESMVLIFPQDSSFSTRSLSKQTNKQFNQSINQSTNQSLSWSVTVYSINQSINSSINQPLACTPEVYFLTIFLPVPATRQMGPLQLITP